VRRSWVRPALALLAVLAGGPAWVPPALADQGPVPGGGVSSTGSGYVGSLLIPPGSRPDPPGLPGAAARCDGCVWTLLPACDRPDLDGGAMCSGAAFSCPAPAERMALWLQRPGDPAPIRQGTVCLDPSVALQPDQLVPGVRDRFARLVPVPRPSFQPRERGLVGLPVLFAAGQPTSIGRPVFDLAGRGIALSATVRWVWDFGDGGQIVTTSPGGGWPDTAVAHTFRARGTYRVVVTAQWAGQFWVDGAGPFTVTGGPVRQTALLVVPVVGARAELVGGSP
jgi:hypothetical protein